MQEAPPRRRYTMCESPRVPPATVRFISAAWWWFAGGIILGGALALSKGGWLPAWLLLWKAAHVHALAVGWAAQWVFGIAFWLYPGWGSERTSPRIERHTKALWVLLNVGTLLRVSGEGFLMMSPAGALRWVFVVGAMAQVCAGLWFVWLIRGRIRPARWIRRDLERQDTASRA